MAFKLLARTREQTATTGTGDITVSGVISSNTIPFSASLSVADTSVVCILSGNATDWEECFVTYSSANTLQRGTVIKNSLGTGAHISLTGSSRVFGIIPNDFSLLFDWLFGSTNGNVVKRVAGIWTAADPLSAIGAGHLLANTSGGSAIPGDASLTALIDAAIGNTRGAILYRGAGGWAILAPGTAAQLLSTGGAGADPSWASGFSLPTIATGHLLGYTGAGTGTAADASLTALIDAALGNTRGSLITRQSGGWSILAPAASGKVPISAGSGADVAYGDVGGVTWHSTVAAATTAALAANTYNNGTSGVGATLTGNANGALAAIDGITPVVGYRILVKNETAAANNGLYIVTQVGDGSTPYILTRVGDFNSTINIFQGDFVGVGPNGTNNAKKIFVSTLSASPLVMGTTGITFSLVTTGDKYIFGSSISGVLAASQQLLYHRFAKAVTIPANFGDYLGYSSEAGGTANATASTVINADKAVTATPNTFSNVGTISIALGTVTPTFASSGGTAISFAKGDVIRLMGPASADATFAGFYATIVGFET